MNVIQAIADDREDLARDEAEDTRRGAVDQALAGHDSASRLMRFDAWLREELAKRLDWAWAGVQRERRIEQCRLHMERLVLELWRRGWMLDGRRLAAHITACLDAIGAYQRRGGVLDFWAWYQSAVNRYVGQNAEELREEAMRAGSHVNQVLGKLLTPAADAGPSIPELIAQRADEVGKAKTLREQQAALRRASKVAATAIQESLPGLAGA